MHIAPPGIDCEALPGEWEGAMGQRDGSFISGQIWGWIQSLSLLFITGLARGVYKLWVQKKMEKEHGASLPRSDTAKFYTLLATLQSQQISAAARHEESMNVAGAVDDQMRIKAAAVIRERSISFRRVMEEEVTAVKESAEKTPIFRVVKEAALGVVDQTIGGVADDMASGNTGSSNLGLGVGGFLGDAVDSLALEGAAGGEEEAEGADDDGTEPSESNLWIQVQDRNLSHLMEFIRAAQYFIKEFDAAINKLSASDSLTDPNLIGNLFEGIQRSSQAATATLADLQIQSPKLVEEHLGDILEQYRSRNRELDTCMNIVMEKFGVGEGEGTEIPKKYADLASKNVKQLRVIAKKHGIKVSDISADTDAATDAATDLEQKYAIIQMIIVQDEESEKTSVRSKRLKRNERPDGKTWHEDADNNVMKITQRRADGSDEVIVDLTRPEAEKQTHWLKIRQQMKLSVLMSHRDAAVGPTLSVENKIPPPPPGDPAHSAFVVRAPAPSAPPRGDPSEMTRVGANTRLIQRKNQKMREAVKIVQSLNTSVSMFKFLMSSDERRLEPVLLPGPEPEPDDSPTFLPGAVPRQTTSAAAGTTRLSLEPAESVDSEDSEDLEADLEHVSLMDLEAALPPLVRQED